MEGINWSLREKARLIDAVKKFKAKHGDVQFDWKILTEEADVRNELLNIKQIS